VTKIGGQEHDFRFSPDGAIVLKQGRASPTWLVSPDKRVKIPIARPGKLDDMDIDTGLPTALSPINQPGLWKFWNPGEVHLHTDLGSFLHEISYVHLLCCWEF
jgi:hypothetical protein